MNAIAHEMGRKDENRELYIAHGNGGRKHEKHEFFRHLSNHVPVVTVAGNNLGNRRMCAIAHEMGKKYENCDT
jgi:phosphoribosylamine-glycine ligase